MKEKGYTPSRMVMLFCYSIFLLVLVFCFIFVGVAAFVGAGAFGAVVNSSLTAFAGIVMNSGKKKKEDGGEVEVED